MTVCDELAIRDLNTLLMLHRLTQPLGKRERAARSQAACHTLALDEIDRGA